MKKKLLITSSTCIFALIFSNHLVADGNRKVCVESGDRSVLEASSISRSSDLDDFELLISCSILGSIESGKKHYGVISKKSESYRCIHEVTSLNDPLKNVFGENEPKRQYYAIFSTEKSCPDFSVEKYTRMPLGMNKYESIQYSESINQFFSKASKSRSSFRSSFKSVGFFNKMLNNFSKFRDSFYNLIENEDIRYIIDEVTYCYDNNQEIVSGGLAVRVKVGDRGSWIIEFDSSGEGMVPNEVYEVI